MSVLQCQSHKTATPESMRDELLAYVNVCLWLYLGRPPYQVNATSVSLWCGVEEVHSSTALASSWQAVEDPDQVRFSQLVLSILKSSITSPSPPVRLTRLS